MDNYIEIDNHLINIDNISIVNFKEKDPVQCVLYIQFKSGDDLEFKNHWLFSNYPLLRKRELEDAYNKIRKYLLNKE